VGNTTLGAHVSKTARGTLPAPRTADGSRTGAPPGWSPPLCRSNFVGDAASMARPYASAIRPAARHMCRANDWLDWSMRAVFMTWFDVGPQPGPNT
jgi:hypothetical protein